MEKLVARSGNVPTLAFISIVALLLALLLASNYGGVAAEPSPAAVFVGKTIEAHKIVIFSKSYCPYCKKAKAVFKELNQKPFVVELDEREDGSKIQDALMNIVGRRTVPQVFINGRHLGGSDDTLEAHESGKLSELLGLKSSGDNDDNDEL